jgi:hypothetical protein
VLLPGRGSADANGVPAPGSRGARGRARAVASRAFTETVPVETSGHQDGHQADKHVSVRAVDGRALDAPPLTPQDDSRSG